MAKLEERLRRELERIATPGDPAGVVQRVGARAAKWRALRRVQFAALAVVVVAGTGLGLYGLTRVFGKGPGGAGAGTRTEPVLFSGRLPEPGAEFALFTVDVATGEVRMVPGSDVGVPETAVWSPDGQRIAFVREEERGIFVMNADGSNVQRLINFGTEPAWSPDGNRIAFEGYGGIWIVDAEGVTAARLAVDQPGGWPAWSPDGSRIVFSGQGRLMLVEPDPDAQPVSLGVEGNRPDWSPDGERIAFARDDGIYVMNADGGDVRKVTTAPGFYLDPSWSPDGSMIAFAYDRADEAACTESGCPQKYEVGIMNADGSGVRQLTDLATNEYRNSGTSPDWFPVIGGTVPEPEPTTTETPTPASEPGSDLGLGFPVCNVTSVEGNFQDAESVATAYVATKVGDTGDCPDGKGAFHVVAVDFTEDGDAEISYGPIECENLPCRAFAAPDVDGDGTDEILVQNVAFSIAGLKLFEVGVRDEPRAYLFPVTVALEGDPEGGFEPGGEPQLWIGGDAFELDWLRCEARPAGRVFVATKAFMDPPDAPDAVWVVHETVSVLTPDGELQVIVVRDFEEPVEDGPSFVTSGGLCGAPLPEPYSGD